MACSALKESYRKILQSQVDDLEEPKHGLKINIDLDPSQIIKEIILNYSSDS